jgi:hypothetical protein
MIILCFHTFFEIETPVSNLNIHKSRPTSVFPSNSNINDMKIMPTDQRFKKKKKKLNKKKWLGWVTASSCATMTVTGCSLAVPGWQHPVKATCMTG